MQRLVWLLSPCETMCQTTIQSHSLSTRIHRLDTLQQLLMPRNGTILYQSDTLREARTPPSLDHDMAECHVCFVFVHLPRPLLQVFPSIFDTFTSIPRICFFTSSGTFAETIHSSSHSFTYGGSDQYDIDLWIVQHLHHKYISTD